jgi:hypothetical protein
MEIHVSKVALAGVKNAVRVCRIVHAVGSPTLRATLACGLRIIGALAHGAVEGREVPAGTPVLPYDATAVGVDTARSIDFNFLVEWRFIEFGAACLRRIRSFLDPHQPLVSAPDSGYPETAILRIYGDGICAKGNPVIPGRIDRLIRLGPSRVDLAVSIGIDDAGAPALGSFGIMGLIPGVDVDPCDPATDPEINKVILADLIMVRAKARVDMLPPAVFD